VDGKVGGGGGVRGVADRNVETKSGATSRYLGTKPPTSNETDERVERRSPNFAPPFRQLEEEEEEEARRRNNEQQLSSCCSSLSDSAFLNRVWKKTHLADSNLVIDFIARVTFDRWLPQRWLHLRLSQNDT